MSTAIVTKGFQVYVLRTSGTKDKWEKEGRMYLAQSAAEQLASLWRSAGFMAEVRSVLGVDDAG